MRPTQGEAYRDGRGTFHPPERRIVRGAEIAGERTVRADACVIGTGAGGAVAAKELAEAGLDVVILEDGEWHDTEEFTARPREMTSRLYRDAGQVTTVGRPPILLPLGRAVGGTTLVNSATCFRTPPQILERWRAELGLTELTDAEMEPWFRRVERETNVAQVPPDLAGHNAEVARRGAERLGWSGDYLYRNAKGCVGSGVCAFGCPSGAKQHVGITYIPRAWAAGATLYTGTRADRIDGHTVGAITSSGRGQTVHAITSGGGRLTVEAEHVVVAAGAIHSPGLLARSGLGTRARGLFGGNLSIHPCTAVKAMFDERIDQWRGVPQSYYVDEFAEQGFLFEGAAGPPDYIAASLPRTGDEHRALMERYPYMAQFGIMICDSSRGRVRTIRGGGTVITYDLNEADTRVMHTAIERLTELYWAAGAREVIVPVAGVPTLRDGDMGPLRAAAKTRASLTPMAFHPLGTARAGADPARSVVDSYGALHDAPNVHVLDGSIVPSALGVNPQVTIMALATRAAHAIAGRPAPTDEPEPERLPDARAARQPLLA